MKRKIQCKRTNLQRAIFDAIVLDVFEILGDRVGGKNCGENYVERYENVGHADPAQLVAIDDKTALDRSNWCHLFRRL